MDDKAKRTEHVVQKIDKQNEAKGHAIRIIGDIKHRRMSPEERARQVQADNDALFGPEI